MINILVIEDNSHKLGTIRDLISSCQGVSKYDCATDINSARTFLQHTFYDLLILDLNIPKRFGDDPLPENSIDLLSELEKSRRLVKPSTIIGLTEFEDLKSRFQVDFEKYLWAIVQYDANSLAWEEVLRNKIIYLQGSKSTLLTSASREYQYDIAFITALRSPELEFVLKLPLDWKVLKLPNDPSEYHTGIYEQDGKKFTFVAGSAPQMGMTAAAVMTMKMIHAFRPKYVVMTGIAAGVAANTAPGDV
jgi:CheY-like chemotaxis protein